MEDSSIADLVSSFLGSGSMHSDVDPGSKKTAERHNPLVSSRLEGDETISKTVKVVIFSKDRPWQLQQLLRTFQLPKTMEHHIVVDVAVLACVTEEYRRGYHHVSTEFKEFIDSSLQVSFNFLEEDPQHSDSLASLLSGLLNSYPTPDYWLFLTDDCILLVPLFDLLETALYALSSYPQDLCFISRLHPGISWCQTRDKPNLPPRLHMQYQPGRTAGHEGTYAYPLKRGSLDWAYPWDLSGGLYRHVFVNDLLSHLQDTDCLSHPNRLELGGNRTAVLESCFDRDKVWIAVPTHPMLLILAINRVQNVCQAPLACDEAERSTMRPDALLQLLDGNRDIDLDSYQTNFYESSHIGDLILDAPTTVRSKSRTTTTDLSVLLPVRTGPPDAAFHAMVSVAMQPIEHHEKMKEKWRRGPMFRLNDQEKDASLLSVLQIVIVDDSCLDGSISAMMEGAQSVAESHRDVVLQVRDHRRCTDGKEETVADENSLGDHSTVQLVVDIYKSPGDGIAAALNHGLSHCTAELVARMDADDIVAPGRFVQQLKILHCRPDLTVVGTDTVIFRHSRPSNGRSDTDEVGSSMIDSMYTGAADLDSLPYSTYRPVSHCCSHKNAILETRISLPPCDACFTAWAMQFSCCISHPSVIIYRKGAIQAAGGYNESYAAAEDYELWLRLTDTDAGALTSIPWLGVWHRKMNTDQAKGRKQSIEAVQAVVNISLERNLESTVRAEHMTDTLAVLRKPETDTSGDVLEQAADLLLSMEAAFLKANSSKISMNVRSLIQEDCNARLGKLASLCLTRFGGIAQEFRVWKVWCERCPDLTLHRISLILEGKNKFERIVSRGDACASFN